MPYEYRKLKGRIVEKYESQEKFSDVVGVSRVTISKKLNGIVGFSQSDITEWSKLLGIGSNEYADYFFN